MAPKHLHDVLIWSCDWARPRQFERRISSRLLENRHKGEEVNELQRPDWKVWLAFYGDKNKEALAMASIGWKKEGRALSMQEGLKPWWIFAWHKWCQTLISGTRYLAFCVYIIQSRLGYAEDLCLRYCSVGRKINYHIHSKIWKAIPLFVLWTLWAPQSCYQKILLRSLYEWMTSLGCIPSSSFLEFINLLNVTL